MKIWTSRSAEHSNAFKIIGTFKTAKDATAAEDALNVIIQAVIDQKTQDYHSIATSQKVHDLTTSDFEGLSLCHNIDSAKGDKIEIFTDEGEIQGLLKILLSKGAKVELYSQHEY